MARLIDANVVLAKKFTTGLSDASGNYYGNADVVFADDIENAPTVDAVEVVHGHDTGRCRIFECSECGYGANDIYLNDEENYPVGEFNYCPHCGKKIDYMR